LSLQQTVPTYLIESSNRKHSQGNKAITDNPVKSISEDYDKSVEPETEKQSQPRSRRNFDRKNAKWIESLKASDVSRLWSDLHRVVSHHPLVRASRSAGLLVEEGGSGAYTDLTQELFVQLLSKNRFEHYLETAMTDYEIECEISQIELTNLLTAELRKRHPESYRLARRISTLIQSSTNFRRFDTSGIDDEPHRRLADRIYGLSEWNEKKSRRGSHEVEQRVQMIPVRQRDTRMVGCTGDSQVVISNPDLEDLIVSVLDAVDSPVDVRTLRSLVMSRLPVMDIYLVPLDGDDSDSENGNSYEPVDRRENPEEGLLRRESEREAAGFVDQFLQNIHETVRGKVKQYNRILGVLWYCYLSSDHATQLEVAAMLGVSDSLVSDYRRRIEQELRALSFSEVEEAKQFEIALRVRVKTLVFEVEEKDLALRSS
jgi:tRNA threonylcarbamoyladenosine modification (KEOPS) complex  Pcc1 subunit